MRCLENDKRNQADCRADNVAREAAPRRKKNRHVSRGSMNVGAGLAARCHPARETCRNRSSAAQRRRRRAYGPGASTAVRAEPRPERRERATTFVDVLVAEAQFRLGRVDVKVADAGGIVMNSGPRTALFDDATL